MTEQEAQSCIDQLPQGSGYTYEVLNDDNQRTYVLCTGPDDFMCAFSDVSYVPWAIEQINAHMQS